MEYNKPIIFHPKNKSEEKKLQALLNSDPTIVLRDSLDQCIEDLFKIEFPYIVPGFPEFQKTYETYRIKYFSEGNLRTYGVWVYYPWRKTMVHILDEHDYTQLRTARNKELITEDEQSMFYNSRISVAGLSVGLSVLNSIVLSGGSRAIYLADPDVLALTNMNRLSASACDIGEKKAQLAARKIYELNPYSQLFVFEEGLLEANFFDFFGGSKPVDLFIEEMDNIQLKIKSRLHARKLRIPVIMATDNGDNAMIDVERFDLEPSRPLFHGLVKEKDLLNIPDKPSMSERVKLASAIVGHDITTRTKISLQLVGTKIPTWPQLGNAATLSGVAVSYVARKILTNQIMPSGRYHINIDETLDVSYNTQTQKTLRDKVEEQYAQGLELLFGVK